MSVLLRTSELEGRPIVTFAGESPAEVKDVIFDSLNGTLLGMTLRGHGLSPVFARTSCPGRGFTASDGTPS